MQEFCRTCLVSNSIVTNWLHFLILLIRTTGCSPSDSGNHCYALCGLISVSINVSHSRSLSVVITSLRAMFWTAGSRITTAALRHSSLRQRHRCRRPEPSILRWSIHGSTSRQSNTGKMWRYALGPRRGVWLRNGPLFFAAPNWTTRKLKYLK